MDKMTSWDLALLLPHTDFSGNVFGNPTEINNFPYLKKAMEIVLNDKLDGKNLIYGILLAIEYRKDLQNVLTFVEGKLFFRNLDCKSGSPWYGDSVRFAGLAQWYRYHQNLNNISYREVKRIVEICVQFELIPSQSQDEFNALITADILCGYGNYVLRNKW